MALSQDAMTRGAAGGPLLGALGVLGLAFAVLTLRRSKPGSRRQHSDKQSALTAYLRDHLAGADAAIQVVKRLSDAYGGTPEGTLFGSLHEQFRADRAVVEAILADLGASHLSMKRLAGHATGRALTAVAGGEPGDLSLFRTLEALAIGVQGKRCLWRAAQGLASSLRAPACRNFVELEADAVVQWEAIERCRRSLVPGTFAL